MLIIEEIDVASSKLLHYRNLDYNSQLYLTICRDCRDFRLFVPANLSW
jgi:hypothetical protein